MIAQVLSCSISENLLLDVVSFALESSNPESMTVYFSLIPNIYTPMLSNALNIPPTNQIPVSLYRDLSGSSHWETIDEGKVKEVKATHSLIRAFNHVLCAVGIENIRHKLITERELIFIYSLVSRLALEQYSYFYLLYELLLMHSFVNYQTATLSI